MKLFGWNLSATRAAASRGRPAASRGRPSWYRNWGAFAGPWSPTLPTEQLLPVYEQMRHLYPVLDTAVKRTVRLVGSPTVEGSARLTADLNGWLDTVQVNQEERGFEAWLGSHLDAMLTFGFGVGEIVPTVGLTDIYALTNLDPLTILLAQGDTPLQLRILQRQHGPQFRVELNPALTLYSVHHSRGRDPHGSSTFRSLPFVAQVLSTILNATAATWEREGTPSYHVNWEPDEKFIDPDGTLTQQIVDGIGDQFKSAMDSRRQHEIRDFFSSGKVSVHPISSAQQLFALQEPFRAMMEQMIAPTDLPAWLLGMHWSTTERLSSQQADLIIAYVNGLRSVLQPKVEYTLDLRQRFVGRTAKFKVTWPPVDLRDRTDEAKANLWEQQAQQVRMANALEMWRLGYWTQLQAAQAADPALQTVATAHDTPPPSPSGALPLQEPPTPPPSQTTADADGRPTTDDGRPPVRPAPTTLLKRAQALLAHGSQNGRDRL